MIKILFFLLFPAVATATERVISEGTPAQKATIMIDTVNVRVGISTRVPQVTLDISGTQAGQTVVRAQNLSATGASSYEFIDSGGVDIGGVGYANGGVTSPPVPGAIFMGTSGLRPATIVVNNVVVTSFPVSGNVLIGTTTDQTAGKLTVVYTPGNQALNLISIAQSAGNRRNWSIAPELDVAGTLSIVNSSVEGGTPDTTRMVIDKNGNVGMGVTTPAYFLDANGAARMTGQFIVGGTATVQGASMGIATATANGVLNIGFAPGVQAIDLLSLGFSAGNRRNWALAPEVDVAGTLSIVNSSVEGAMPNTTRMVIDKNGNVGIGNTAPISTLQVSGHLRFGGTAPTVSACGTAPAGSVVAGSTDNAGAITVGGGLPVACTLNFATVWENSVAPSCSVIGSAGTTRSLSAVGTSAITINSGVAESTLWYVCF